MAGLCSNGSRSGLVRLDIADPRWFAFVRSRPEATYAHHPRWAHTVATSYGVQTFALALTDAAGHIVAGLPVIEAARPLLGRRWLSLPFTDHCPVLAGPDHQDGLVAVLPREVEAEGLSGFEVHGALPGHGVQPGPVRWVQHTRPLAPDPNADQAMISKLHRRNIRKAEREGVRVRIGCSDEDVETFYRLHLLTRRRLGVPVQPRRFFTLLGRRVLQRGLGVVVSGWIGERPVSASVFLAWNGALTYKYGASDERYRRFRPNNLVMWSGIRWGIERGCHTLDLGRTDLSNAGLRRFKDGWGARETPLAYTAIPSSAGRGIPTDPLQHLLALTIRATPNPICRLAGELLYRYAM
jgi:CelD/BcsL family acetyltransferase involved in cellulose biosynthesis